MNKTVLGFRGYTKQMGTRIANNGRYYLDGVGIGSYDVTKPRPDK